MIYRSKRKIEEGFVAIVMGDGEYEVHLDAKEYANALDCFLNGKAFLKAYDLVGGLHTIKVARITGIVCITPEAVARKMEEEKEEDAFETLGS